MAKYLILNIVFICVVLLVMRVRPVKPKPRWWLTLAILLFLTAIFDSLIIAANIVSYNQENISGLYIGKAPVEDFAYALMAAIIVPFLWNKDGDK